jgi:hypothetical protein
MSQENATNATATDWPTAVTSTPNFTGPPDMVDTVSTAGTTRTDPTAPNVCHSITDTRKRTDVQPATATILDHWTSNVTALDSADANLVLEVPCAINVWTVTTDSVVLDANHVNATVLAPLKVAFVMQKPDSAYANSMWKVSIVTAANLER